MVSVDSGTLLSIKAVHIGECVCVCVGGWFPEGEIQVLKEKKGRMPDKENSQMSALEKKVSVARGTGRDFSHSSLEWQV